MTTAPHGTETAPVAKPRRKRAPKTVITAPWDTAEILTTPGRIQALLEVSFEEEDAETNGYLVVHALNAIVRKRGVAEVAAAAGLNPTGLYKMLSPGRQPSIATVLRVMRALGYRLAPIRLGEAEDGAEHPQSGNDG